MKERNVVIIISSILLILGVVTIYLSLTLTSFTFSKTELAFNGINVQEKLFYNTNKAYHTLYRDFQTKLSDSILTEDYIKINKVRCEQGENYYNNYNSCAQGSCALYTELNEYGCTFGNSLGFEKGNEYSITAEYELHPQNLIKIGNKFYIKFIAYSPGKHPLLIKGKNFFVSEDAVTKSFFMPQQFVAVYVPFNGETSGFSVIEQSSFEYNRQWLLFVLIIIAIFPSIFFFLIWYFFGREHSFSDIPESLSTYPEGRKPWEVAAFFNPPFGSLNSSALLLDFQRRKIIQLKSKDKKTLVKILKKEDSSLDEVEKAFLDLLIEQYDSVEEKEQGFADLLEMSKHSLYQITKASALRKSVQEKNKDYLETGGKVIGMLGLFFVVLFACFFAAGITGLYLVIPFLFVSLIIMTVVATSSAILMRFKGDFYKEYQHWQAFKNYLKQFPSMKEAPHEAVVLWEQYLVYATALGVASGVLKKLRDWKIIDEKTYANYNTFIVHSNYAGGSYGASGGGGFGGGGGGGVGGGGGGGR
jgi:uncharacterized membrane protein